MLVLLSLAVGSRPEGLQVQAPSAASRILIPTGSRRSGSFRRWRGTGFFPSPLPEARRSRPRPLASGRPAAAFATALVSPSCQRRRGECSAPLGPRVLLPLTYFITLLESSSCFRAAGLGLRDFWGTDKSGLGAPLFSPRLFSHSSCCHAWLLPLVLFPQHPETTEKGYTVPEN